jgi:hypothetical protein
VNLSEPTIYRERRQRALNAWFRIISKGRVVIKKILSVVVAMSFATGLVLSVSAAPGSVTAGDDPNGQCGACWHVP